MLCLCEKESNLACVMISVCCSSQHCIAISLVTEMVMLYFQVTLLHVACTYDSYTIKLQPLTLILTLTL